MKAEEIKDIFKKEGFLHIYEWVDKPGALYPEHYHRGRVSFYVIRGSIEIAFGDEKHTLTALQRIDISPGVLHVAMVGDAGCEYIVAEDIEGDS